MIAARTGKPIEIGPQPGPQTAFIASKADIVIYGGAAGGGKTFGLLLDPLIHKDVPEFGGVIFRRTMAQVKNQGGLWDTSVALYSLFGARPRSNVAEWVFPSGMSISFAGLEHETSVLDHQGSQIPWMGWDELTHFSEQQFFYMLSRNRSTSGVRPRVRGGCNPDPDSWVKRLIRWWLDENGEYADPKKSGVIRWFVRLGDKIHWADSREELVRQFGETDEIRPKSLTFIPSKLEDNRILMQTDPDYLGNLLAMNRVDRERLRHGNWKVRPAAGSIFQRTWFPIVEQIPPGWIAQCRFWDRASTKPNEQNKDPDWTRGLKLLKYPNNTFVVADLKSMRDTPGQVESFIRMVAMHDGPACRIKAQQDPGSAGAAEAEHFVKALQGFDVRVQTMSKDKLSRAKPVSAQAEFGFIKVLRAPWNEEFFAELENFSEDPKEYDHDDICDCLSGSYNELSGGMSIADVL